MYFIIKRIIKKTVNIHSYFKAKGYGEFEASITIEASYLMPLILLIIAAIIVIGFRLNNNVIDNVEKRYRVIENYSNDRSSFIIKSKVALDSISNS